MHPLDERKIALDERLAARTVAEPAANWNQLMSAGQGLPNSSNIILFLPEFFALYIKASAQ
jgi:hypothetical protein